LSPVPPSERRRLRLASAEDAPQARGHVEEAPAPFWEATIARQHGRRDYWLRRALALVDVVAITGALALAFAASTGHPVDDIVWILPILPLWVGLFGLYGLYGRDVKRIGQRTIDDVPSLFHALLLGSLGLWAYYRVLPEPKLILGEIVVFGVASMALILALRWLVRHVATSIFGPERVLLVGLAPVIPALVRKMRAHPEYALEPVGVVRQSGVPSGAGGSTLGSLPVLGTLREGRLLDLIQLHDIDRIIVSEEEVDDGAILDLFRECGRAQVKVSILPRGVETMGPSMEVDDIEGVTVLGLNPLVLSRSSRALKRSMDVVGATVALVLTMPLMLLAGIAVKLASRGPVFFRQDRVGRSGKTFTLYKFRTMVRDAESRTEELMASSEDKHWLKLQHDPRITRAGRLLRLLSIDELPQLWSVLTGNMSLVGPRPLTPADHQQVERWARIRLDLAPGITGLWQVLGRTSIPFEEMIKLDYVYVTNWSLWTDMRLLIKTVPAVLGRRGAN
jgi:exopolysaccharide biosynthesis polyprenyl glycosylphosphotransferase